MHAAALVIVPKEGADDPVKWVGELMAPYDENTDPDNGWWDWWRVGGRYDGHFLGLARLDDNTPAGNAIHYSDAVERLDRNSGPAANAGEWDTYAVVSPEGYREKKCSNPAWREGDGWETYNIPTPDYAQWRVEQLMKYRDGIVVVVDYHS